jgi:Zn-dependent membrane protease YugP
MFFRFDPNYFWYVFIPTILLSLAVQIYLKRTFKTWSKVENEADLTGRQVADRLFEETSLEPIPVQRINQPLGDHFDPKKNVVRLSPPVGDADSVSAMAVTAHELGHVQQYQTGSGLIKARSFLLPAVRFSPTITYICALMGLFFNMTNLLWVALFFFGITVLFSLLTLPVEFDASKRGMAMLHETELFGSEEEARGARKVLTAAALTYVASFITSVLQFIYYLRRVNREVEEDQAREARRQANKQRFQSRKRP